MLTRREEIAARRRAGAAHEAAHAIAAMALGAEVIYVELYADDTGFTRHRGLPAGEPTAIVSMAGPIAEQLLCPDGFGLDSGDRDYERAGEHVAPGRVEAVLDETRRLVREHRGAIERVAGVLFERGYLDGRELHHVVGSGTGRR